MMLNITEINIYLLKLDILKDTQFYGFKFLICFMDSKVATGLNIKIGWKL